MTATPPGTLTRRRPAPVTILAVIQAIGATSYVASIAAIDGVRFEALQELAARGITIATDDAITTTLFAGMLLAMAVIGYAAAILLFRMQRLGWTVTMLLAGWSLASQIYLYVTSGDLSPTIMLLQVVIVLYLNQRQVRAAFGIGHTAVRPVPELDERE